MGAKTPKLPDPNAETPGVILGDEGFKLSHQLATLTGQPARGFRQSAAGAGDPIAFLQNLLRTERRRPQPAAGSTPSAEPPPRTDPAIQTAGTAAARRRSGGRASTIITALEGALPSGSAIRKTLLGGFS